MIQQKLEIRFREFEVDFSLLELWLMNLTTSLNAYEHVSGDPRNSKISGTNLTNNFQTFYSIRRIRSPLTTGHLQGL